MHLIDYMRELSSKGRYHFTSTEAEAALKVTRKSLNMSLFRMSQKHLIASPAKNFYLIVPPEYMPLGCLPPDQFIPHLMQYWGLPYYVCLLSAAEYYGSGHQRSQHFQVMTIRHKPDIQCGRVNIRFIGKKDLNDFKGMSFHTPRSIVSVSTPEVTAMDLMNYPWQSGGLNHIATVLSELSEAMNVDEVVKLAKQSKERSWIQRLAYLLKIIDAHQLAAALLAELKNKKTHYIPLNPDLSMKGYPRDSASKVVVNMKIESDL